MAVADGVGTNFFISRISAMISEGSIRKGLLATEPGGAHVRARLAGGAIEDIVFAGGVLECTYRGSGRVLGRDALTELLVTAVCRVDSLLCERK